MGEIISEPVGGFISEWWAASPESASMDRDLSPEYLETDFASASFDVRFTSAVNSRFGGQDTAPLVLPCPIGTPRAPSTGSRGSAPFPILLPAATMKRLRVADASAEEDSGLLSDAPARITICDISAHMVYLPNGLRLEAHSGLGKYRDDPRHVSEKDRGPTFPQMFMTYQCASTFFTVFAPSVLFQPASTKCLVATGYSRIRLCAVVVGNGVSCVS